MLNSKILKDVSNNLETERTKNKRVSWDEYYISNAAMISSRSSCPRLSVGCTLVKDNMIIATGYNGSASGDIHCIDEGCLTVDGHCIRAIHAEVNAVTQCAKRGVSCKDATAYVTHFPCLNCAKTLVQAGIIEVNYAVDYKNSQHVYDLFERLNIEVNKVPIDKTKLMYKMDEVFTFEDKI